MKMPKKLRQQRQRAQLKNPVLINFEHRLCISGGRFDHKGAQPLVEDMTERLRCVLELVRNNFTNNQIEPLSNEVIFHVLTSILMEMADISALIQSFQQSEKQTAETEYIFNTLWQHLDDAKEVIKKLCRDIVSSVIAKENNKQTCQSIDEVKVDIVNINRLFSELCQLEKPIKNKMLKKAG